MSEKRYQGTIIFFSTRKGWGFAEWYDENKIKQKDMFIHYSDILCEGFKTLMKDQKISFEIGKNVKGDPKAINVKIES